MSQSYTGVKGTPFSDLFFFRRAGKPGFATAGDDRGDKARGTGPRRGPPPRGRMDPEFYVEKPNKLIELTIATLNAGISIGIAASLAGSLIALHARGGPGDLATKKPCPTQLRRRKRSPALDRRRRSRPSSRGSWGRRSRRSKTQPI